MLKKFVFTDNEIATKFESLFSQSFPPLCLSLSPSLSFFSLSLSLSAFHFLSLSLSFSQGLDLPATGDRQKILTMNLIPLQDDLNYIRLIHLILSPFQKFSLTSSFKYLFICPHSFSTSFFLPFSN